MNSTITVKDIPGYRGKYKVDEFGSVYSMPSERSIYNTPRLLKSHLTVWGYYQLKLPGKRYRIHQIVALAFLPERPTEKHVLDHIDGNKKNNHYQNLRWVTMKENTGYAKALGLLNPPIGERCAQHKLKEKDVIYIRSMKGKLTQKFLANQFGVDQSTISYVMTGKSWSYL